MVSSESASGTEEQDLDYSQAVEAVMFLLRPEGLRAVLSSMLKDELEARLAEAKMQGVIPAGNDDLKLEQVLPDDLLHNAHTLDPYAAVDVAMQYGLMITTCCIPDCHMVKTNGHWDQMLERHKEYSNPTETYCPSCEADFRNALSLKPLMGLQSLGTVSRRSLARVCDGLPSTSSESVHIQGS